MDELRQLPRWEIKKEAKVWMPQMQEFCHGFVEDMHLKGMRVSFNKRLPQQQAVKMSFAMGDNFDFIKFEAQMPWVKEEQGRYVYGLSFSYIDDDNKDRISKYLNAFCFDQFRKNWWAI